MFFDSKVSVKRIIEYDPDDAYRALLSAFRRFENCAITASNEAARIIDGKTESSWKTWGEKLTASVNPSGERDSEITVTSSLKRGFFDWGQNQKNVDNLLELLSYTLQDYEKNSKKK